MYQGHKKEAWGISLGSLQFKIEHKFYSYWSRNGQSGWDKRYSRMVSDSCEI
jgi:hypothetical protein